MGIGSPEKQLAQMTNDEARMTKEARMTNPEFKADGIYSTFGFRHSFVIRASAFVISQNAAHDIDRRGSVRYIYRTRLRIARSGMKE
jgi:hypothetical protein